MGQLRIKKKQKKVKKQKIKRGKKAKKNEKFSWKRFSFKLAVLIFFGILIYVLIYSSVVNVNEIEIENLEINKAQNLKQEIQKTLEGTNWLKINRQNFFFLSKSNLEEFILDNFLTIESVKINKIFPNKLIIEVEEYDIIPIFCVEKKNEHCLILNNEGKAIQEANFNDEKLKANQTILIIDENSNDKEVIQINQEILTQEKIDNIIFLGKELTYVLDTKIKQPYFIPARGADEAKFITDDGWYILVDITQEPNITLKTLKLFFDKVFFANKKSDLEYIDIRLKDKIFYKAKNDELELDLKTDETGKKSKKDDVKNDE
jgi:cell division septal protein FtsQ